MTLRDPVWTNSQLMENGLLISVIDIVIGHQPWWEKRHTALSISKIIIIIFVRLKKKKKTKGVSAGGYWPSSLFAADSLEGRLTELT